MKQQGVYAIQYEEEKSQQLITTQAGLLLYLELADVSGFLRSIERHLHVRTDSQGWTDPQVVFSVVLLNLSGGKCVEDISILENDGGFRRLCLRTPLYRLPAPDDPEYLRRWPKKRLRTFPSPAALFRYLAPFHDPLQETLRVAHQAFIPQPNGYLAAFPFINHDLLGFLQTKRPQTCATLDLDATLVATYKHNALYGYKGFAAYQPVNVWWAEMDAVLYTEFRDGNVPASYQLLRVFQEALCHLPDGVQQVRLRSDSAGYAHELLSYCDSGKHPRFGRIEFAVSCDVTEAFKAAVREVNEADWHPLYEEYEGTKIKTNREWAELCFIPQGMGLCSSSPVYRYLAVREPYSPKKSARTPRASSDLPFPTITLQGHEYKLFGTVSNMDWEGEQLLHWQHKRCGKSEEAHSIMKTDLAGGQLPSGDFGENAAWWWMMILALNLNSVFKRLVLGETWLSKRLKALRRDLLHLPARIIERGRQLFVRITDHAALELLLYARNGILALVAGPAP